MDFYAVQRLVGKIDDVPELRNEFISIFNTKSKHDMARFGLALGEHLIALTGFDANKEITDAFTAVQEWINGNSNGDKKVNYHKSRNAAGLINDLARSETDKTKVKFYRNMAQIACIPHVKFHSLWATDFAVALINRLYPNDIDMVSKERKIHIELLEAAYDV